MAELLAKYALNEEMLILLTRKLGEERRKTRLYL